MNQEKLEIVKDRSEAAPNFQNFEFSRGFHCDLRSQNKFELFSKYSILYSLSERATNGAAIYK